MSNDMRSQPKVICAQPDALPEPGVLGHKVVILDIAFALPIAGREHPLFHPKTRSYYRHCFEQTTLAFIQTLGERLVLWVDHHLHDGWQAVRQDSRFVLTASPACALLIDETVCQDPALEQVDTIVCHSDLDGLISTGRFLRKGGLPYPEALKDAVAADTRTERLSPLGCTLDLALKSGDPKVPRLVLDLMINQGKSSLALLDAAAGAARRINDVNQPPSHERRRVGRCHVSDVRDAPGPVNLTALLCALQEDRQTGIVIHSRDDRELLAIADRHVDLPGALGLPGGSASRVLLDAGHLGEVVERLTQGEYAISPPRRAVVEISRRCNLACPLCPVGNQSAKRLGDMQTLVFQKVVDFFGAGLNAMTLHNYGEPLLHPDVGTLIRRAKAGGIPHVDLTTNGNVLSPELAQDLVASGLDCIRFSVDTSDPVAYAHYRRNGCLERVLENMELLATAKRQAGTGKPEIQAQALLMKDNEKSAARFREDLLGHGADHVRWKTFNVFMSGIEMGKKGFTYLPVMPALRRYADSRPTPAGRRQEIKLCTWPWDRLVVLADGTLVPCCHDFSGDYALGNLHDGSTVHEIWETKARRRFMIRRILDPMSIPMCRRCSSAVERLGLRREAEVGGGDA